MPIFKNARLTFVTCRHCPRQHPLRVDQDTRRIRACRGFGVPLRSGNPLPRAFHRLLGAPCPAGQRLPDPDLDWTITSSSPASPLTAAAEPTGGNS